MSEEKRIFTQEDVNYILELNLIQGDLFAEATQELNYDLHDYGKFVTSVFNSKTLSEAWNEDDGSRYPYLSELYSDTELIKKAIKEIM